MATVTLATLKGDFFRHLGQRWSSTATGGSTTKLTDSAIKNLLGETWPDGYTGKQLRLTSGSASGDLRLVVEEDRTEGDLFPNADFSAAVANADTYEVWGAAIHGGQQLTDLFNDVLRRLKLPVFTRLTITDYQDIYDVSAMVNSSDEIVRLWQRHLNYNAAGDYRPYQWDGWEAWRSAGASTPLVHLRLPRPITGAVTTQLNGSLTSNATTVTVDATADLGSADVAFSSSGRIVIDSELIDYTGTTATTFTGCTRGAGGSTAAAHSDNANVDPAGAVTYWVEHKASVAALSTDASTVDAVYRDHLAWETVLEFCVDRMANGPQGDVARWARLGQRAVAQLGHWRAQYEQMEPIRIRPQRWT